MRFYLLAGLAVVAVAFLVMLSVQLFRIEKAVGVLAERVEIQVKKLFLRKPKQ
ncbi:MAG: hypothetical protein MUF22_08710 [Chitinispirillaceae bacterium]|jgi:hypothetical protein|nr:hypothetical protein [Chitinispirillaceae bacterium]